MIYTLHWTDFVFIFNVSIYNIQKTVRGVPRNFLGLRTILSEPDLAHISEGKRYSNVFLMKAAIFPRAAFFIFQKKYANNSKRQLI